MKSYTDLEQSKKLAKILPLESADMYYSHEFVNSAGDYYKLNIAPEGYFDDEELLGSDIPAWSLATLLDVIPILDNRSPVLSKTFDRKYRVVYHSTAYEKAIHTEDFDNPVDACVGMVEKLNELNLL